MKIHRRLFLVALLVFVQAAAFAQDERIAPLKVLFIGNSYAAANDLPSMVEGLADAAGGRKIHTDRHLVGGCTLERHVKEKKAIDKIQAEKWDVVVLQEQSLRPVLDRQSMHEYARTLDAEIKQQGAKTAFYLPWARQHIPDMQEGADPATSPGYARAMHIGARGLLKPPPCIRRTSCCMVMALYLAPWGSTVMNADGVHCRRDRWWAQGNVSQAGYFQQPVG